MVKYEHIFVAHSKYIKICLHPIKETLDPPEKLHVKRISMLIFSVQLFVVNTLLYYKRNRKTRLYTLSCDKSFG